MPIHDWTKVFAGVFHDFHLEWIARVKHALNAGLLPPGFYAMAEQIIANREPDVLTLRTPGPATPGTRPEGAPAGRAIAGGGAVALADVAPKVRYRVRDEASQYAQRARAVTIRHRSDHVVIAVVELVSPGNKSGRRQLREFVAKAQGCIEAGVHLLVVDLFPPGPRDPHGVHPEIWGTDSGGDGFTFVPDKPLTCAAYRASEVPEAFIEPVAVGDLLPDMPVFLGGDTYVSLPLERTYAEAFAEVPAVWRDELQPAG